jgi:predicted DNA-binding WGR domain protein
MAPKRKAGSFARSALPSAKRARGSGGRSVDPKVPNARSLKVVDDYAIKLNQTHINANNNKFYIIQALEGGGKFYAWNRWGRVGEDGANKLAVCASKDKAIKEFESKFRQKTKNSWANRANFKPVKGKYSIIETDDSGGGADKAPMGKLTEAQIKKGQTVLRRLKQELKSGSKTKIEESSSEFYTLIPHDFGRRRPPPINNAKMLAAKEELLKFYLRMGFDNIESKAGLGPISGVMSLPVPKTLGEACRGICDTGSVKSCETRGRDLASKQAGKPKKKMEPAHYGAISLYTSNAIYSQINKCLRDERRGQLTKYFKYLRLFFDAAGCLPAQKRKLYRGVAVDLKSNAQYEKGKTVTWWSISSCTSDRRVADNFAGGCSNSTVFTINSKTGFDVDALSCFQGEKESILCPGTKLKVLSRTSAKGVTRIDLDEVGRAIE